MKPVFKVLLATAAVVGVAKLAKGNCTKNGKCSSMRERRMGMMDKVRNMSDEEYTQFKNDIRSGNFKKVREEWKQQKQNPETNP